MSVKVILSIFSGRRNPEITISDAAAKKLFESLSIGNFKKRTAKSTPLTSMLGYSGLIIEQGEKKFNSDLPSTIYLSHDSVFADEKYADTDINSSKIKDFVMDNLSSFKGIDDIKNLKKTIDANIDSYLSSRNIYKENYFKYYDKTLAEFLHPFKYKTCYCAPVPDLINWNGSFQGANNCYNYSTNYRTDTFAQPGEASGILNTNLSSCNPTSGVSVKSGAISDGLIELPTNNNTCPSKGHLVALVIAPNSDYHWFRKCNTGKWSHKPGSTAATILDNSGLPITDPRTANRGSYTLFCSFMQVIHGHFKIK